MCNKGRIVGIANEDSSNAFCAPIGMECVGWNGMSAETQPVGRWLWLRASTFLFNILSLTRLGSFCNSLAEQRHELAVTEGQASHERRLDCQSIIR